MIISKSKEPVLGLSNWRALQNNSLRILTRATIMLSNSSGDCCTNTYRNNWIVLPCSLDHQRIIKHYYRDVMQGIRYTTSTHGLFPQCQTVSVLRVSTHENNAFLLRNAYFTTMQPHVVRMLHDLFPVTAYSNYLIYYGNNYIGYIVNRRETQNVILWRDDSYNSVAYINKTIWIVTILIIYFDSGQLKPANKEHSLNINICSSINK